jgi:two-component system NtrC family sensor kinase
MVEEHNTKLGAALRERRRITEQLRRSQERYRALVETAFAGISMTDSDERLTFVNPGLCEMLGYEAEELQDKSLSELTDPDEFQRYAEYTQRRQQGLRNYYETSIYHKNGSQLNILISASPLTAADGSFEGTIAVITDITVLRRAEAELEEAKRAYTENLEDTVKERTRALDLAQAQLIQSEKMAAMGKLAAGVAHEVNNPAGVLLMKLNFLLSIAAEESLSSRAISTLEVAVEQTARINQIVENLLSFSRPSSGIPQTVDVNKVVGVARSLSVRAMSTNGLDFKIELWSGPLLVKADPNELEQVLINLINNAVDAMPEGGTLCVSTEATPERCEDGATQIVSIKVTDTGNGIPDDFKDLIFDPFFTTKQVGKGTGLGLSVSYGIVEKLGGRIEVETVRHRGTTMIVRLPGMGESD